MHDVVVECFEKNQTMTRQMLANADVLRGMTAMWAEAMYKGFAAMRERARI